MEDKTVAALQSDIKDIERQLMTSLRALSETYGVTVEGVNIDYAHSFIAGKGCTYYDAHLRVRL